MTRASFLSIVALLFVACSPAGEGTPAASYVVTISSSSLALPSVPYGVVSTGIDSATLRLDVGTDVTVTSRWGTPVAYSAIDDGHGHVELTPTDASRAAQLAGRTGPFDGWATTADATRLVLDGSIRDGVVVLAENGVLEGPVRLVEGDVEARGTVSAVVTIAPDAVAPDARVSAPALRGGVILPWETVTLEVAEPVDAADVLAHVSGTPGMASLDPATGEVSALRFSTPGWWPAHLPAEVDLAAGYTDRMGNVGIPHTLDVAHLGNVDAVTALGYDGTALGEVYGTARAAATGGLHCEDGTDACASITRDDLHTSCFFPGGVFVHLHSDAPRTAITFRVRAVAGPVRDPYSLARGYVDVHAIAAERDSHTPTEQVLHLPVTASPSGDRDSGWTTLSLALPSPMTDVGVAIDLASTELCPVGLLSAVPESPTAATLLVDDITLATP